MNFSKVFSFLTVKVKALPLHQISFVEDKCFFKISIYINTPSWGKADIAVGAKRSD